MGSAEHDARARAAVSTVTGFVLIVGNARSGSSLLGAVLDAHPSAIVANEAEGSVNLWRHLTGPEILHRIYETAARNAAAGRPSEGYRYQIGPPPGEKLVVRLAGDKAWNPALLMLHGNPRLLPSLEERLAMPVRLVHTIRNPFDTIATMHRRSGASLADRTRWYFMHCDAAAALEERLPADRFLNSHHADLLTDPAGELQRLCAFLGLPACDEHRAAVTRRLYDRPRRTADSVPWTAGQIADVLSRMAQFDFLHRYLDESPAGADRG
jgi:hypothetical protein